MHVESLEIPEVKLITLDVHTDDRGYFFELYNSARYVAEELGLTWVQDNISYSRHGVLRGLHYQDPNPQAKLVTVLRGEIFDVAVDVRRGSPTFGRWVGVTLKADESRQLLVPAGFAHGLLVTGGEALVHYKVSELYDPTAEKRIMWDDPAIGIEWPSDKVVLSSKDQRRER